MAAADPAGGRSRSREIAYGGMTGALILLALTASAWLPTADLALLSITSLALAIAVIETGRRSAWIIYAATGLISLAWPGLAFSWPFLIFFGPYPLLRASLDSRFTPTIAWLTRILTGLTLTGLAIGFFGLSVVRENSERFGIWLWGLLPVGSVLVISLYDLALGMMIHFYGKHLRRSR
ncbi:MAG: hypothetical protein SCM11_16390 [Bacillota bacterium]|nr:hypothetical protein [Bacillota bacterium]